MPMTAEDLQKVMQLQREQITSLLETVGFLQEVLAHQHKEIRQFASVYLTDEESNNYAAYLCEKLEPLGEKTEKALSSVFEAQKGLNKLAIKRK